ncbi:type III toxin-antitoxin system ToxN/AbiQ family toxin [Avibacterium avium]|uniref:type III toxin-antitoxin system ToxN/AbiQ family toxin n=1 Tax=Avibacterium avium TaxID=751 RepID=UPI003BF7E8B2
MSKSQKYKLYHINTSFLNYLREFEPKIPLDKSNQGKARPFLGILIETNGYKYLAPLSSKIHNTQTDFVVKHKQGEGKKIATVRFAYMFPVPESQLIEISFKKMEIEDPKYSALLKAEINYINHHKDKIRKRANLVYKNQKNNIANFRKFCCNFSKLESIINAYIKQN